MVVINQDIYLVDPIANQYADIIFPAATWGEEVFTRANGERRVRLYTISKDTAVCGQGTREVNFVRVADGHLLDAVVFLVKVKEGKPFDEATATLTLNHEGCEFHPFLSVLRNKGELTALNSDPVLHNIHVYDLIGKAQRTLLNVSQPNQGDEMTKEIKARKGDGLKIECDARGFMYGFCFRGEKYILRRGG